MQEVDYLTCLSIPSTYEPSRIGLETQNQVQKWRCAQKHHRMRGIVSMTPTVLSSYTIRHDRNLKQKTWPLRSTCLSFSKLLDASCINHITTNLFLDASTAPKEWLPLPHSVGWWWQGASGNHWSELNNLGTRFGAELLLTVHPLPIVNILEREMSFWF